MIAVRIVIVLVMVLSLGQALSKQPQLLAQQQPILRVSPSSLNFEAPLDGPTPAPRSLAVSNTGQGLLKWQASIDGLAISTHQGMITIEALETEGSPIQVVVTLTLNTPARLEVSPTRLSFSAQEGENNPNSQSLILHNTGEQSLNWTASDDAGWLSLNPANGTLAAGQSTTALVLVNISNLSAATYKTEIKITTPEAKSNSGIVLVELAVLEAEVPSGRTLRVPSSEFSTIQTALDAARDGDTILVGPGTYEGNWGITSSVTLKGEDKERVILKGVQAGNPVIAIVAPIQVTIEGLSITEVGKEGVDRGVAGILVNGFAEVVIRNNRIFRIIGGPDSQGGIFPLGFGIQVQGFAKVTISDNEITENANIGILVDGGTDVIITNNTITRNPGCGIVIERTQPHVRIQDNRISWSGCAISLGTGGGEPIVEISNNEITQNQGFPAAVFVSIFECAPTDPFATEKFGGTLNGKGNTFEGNVTDVCPAALQFLKTPGGGQYPPSLDTDSEGE